MNNLSEIQIVGGQNADLSEATYVSIISNFVKLHKTGALTSTRQNLGVPDNSSSLLSVFTINYTGFYCIQNVDGVNSVGAPDASILENSSISLGSVKFQQINIVENTKLLTSLNTVDKTYGNMGDNLYGFVNISQIASLRQNVDIEEMYPLTTLSNPTNGTVLNQVFFKGTLKIDEDAGASTPIRFSTFSGTNYRGQYFIDGVNSGPVAVNGIRTC